MTGDVLKQALRTRLAAEPEVCFALLHGSRAKGNARPDSDIDVAVYLDPALDSRQRFDRRLRLSAALDDLGAVDIAVLNDSTTLLAHRALMGERLVVRDRRLYVDFFCRVLAASGDEAYWREIHAAARRERLRRGTYGRP